MKVMILKEKYNSFPENSRNIVENLSIPNFYIQDITIKDPNNPARFLEAKLLSYEE
jgi:preprotein translocase subunit SecB